MSTKSTTCTTSQLLKPGRQAMMAVVAIIKSHDVVAVVDDHPSYAPIDRFSGGRWTIAKRDGGFALQGTETTYKTAKDAFSDIQDKVMERREFIRWQRHGVR